ncbi:MAG TPA: hypothetical protein VGS41_01000, partial [Chthonomonadales bacterium]|nr:hypothetical protein [Chthonomonadales bacterium]
MALSILAWALVDGAGSPDDGATVAAPAAGYWYDLDVAWGPGAGDAGAAVETALGGCTKDTAYRWPSAAHRVTVPS